MVRPVFRASCEWETLSVLTYAEEGCICDVETSRTCYSEAVVRTAAMNATTLCVLYVRTGPSTLLLQHQH